MQKVTAVRVISRSEWGAKPPTHVTEQKLPVNKVAVTFTETPPCFSNAECIKVLRELQDKHMAAGEPDIRHHFLAGGHGALYQGRGFHAAGPTYQPSPNKIEQLNGQCLDIAYMARSTGDYLDRAQNALTYIICKAAFLGHVTKDYTSYYIAFDEIMYEQTPSDRFMDMKSQKLTA